MKFMKPNLYPETQFTTDSMSPTEIFRGIKEMSDMWVLNDPDYVPLSSSEIRQSVALLMRRKFFVISGEMNG